MEKMGIFNTPNSTQEVWDWIEQRCSGSEKIAAYTAAGMLWNFFADLEEQKDG